MTVIIHTSRTKALLGGHYPLPLSKNQDCTKQSHLVPRITNPKYHYLDQAKYCECQIGLH